MFFKFLFLLCFSSFTLFSINSRTVFDIYNETILEIEKISKRSFDIIGLFKESKIKYTEFYVEEDKANEYKKIIFYQNNFLITLNLFNRLKEIITQIKDPYEIDINKEINKTLKEIWELSFEVQDAKKITFPDLFHIVSEWMTSDVLVKKIYKNKIIEIKYKKIDFLIERLICIVNSFDAMKKDSQYFLIALSEVENSLNKNITKKNVEERIHQFKAIIENKDEFEKMDHTYLKNSWTEFLIGINDLDPKISSMVNILNSLNIEKIYNLRKSFFNKMIDSIKTIIELNIILKNNIEIELDNKIKAGESNRKDKKKKIRQKKIIISKNPKQVEIIKEIKTENIDVKKDNKEDVIINNTNEDLLNEEMIYEKELDLPQENLFINKLIKQEVKAIQKINDCQEIKLSKKVEKLLFDLKYGKGAHILKYEPQTVAKLFFKLGIPYRLSANSQNKKIKVIGYYNNKENDKFVMHALGKHLKDQKSKHTAENIKASLIRLLNYHRENWQDLVK